MKKLPVAPFFFSLLVLVIIGTIFLVVLVSNYIKSPFIHQQALEFQVAPGDTLPVVLSKLRLASAVKHPRLLYRLASLVGNPDQIAAGEYLLLPGESLSGLLRMLAKGEVVLRSITFPEGWTFRQFLQKLHSRSDIRATLKELDDAQIMEQLGHTTEVPEGRFAPDTYRFVRNATDREILLQAYELQERSLQEEWQNRGANLPLKTAYQALVLASIIEKEAAIASERAKISGVYLRRLEKRMRLQADATVIYGMKDKFDGNLRRQDLRHDTPHNSYTRAGLPPTPIANPGRPSIRAALHPEQGDALYYVAKGDGSHHFSATMEEHNRAVAKYQLGQ